RGRRFRGGQPPIFCRSTRTRSGIAASGGGLVLVAKADDCGACIRGSASLGRLPEFREYPAFEAGKFARPTGNGSKALVHVSKCQRSWLFGNKNRSSARQSVRFIL